MPIEIVVTTVTGNQCSGIFLQVLNGNIPFANGRIKASCTHACNRSSSFDCKIIVNLQGTAQIMLIRIRRYVFKQNCQTIPDDAEISVLD